MKKLRLRKVKELAQGHKAELGLTTRWIPNTRTRAFLPNNAYYKKESRAQLVNKFG